MKGTRVQSSFIYCVIIFELYILLLLTNAMADTVLSPSPPPPPPPPDIQNQNTVELMEG